MCHWIAYKKCVGKCFVLAQKHIDEMKKNGYSIYNLKLIANLYNWSQGCVSLVF